MANRSGIIALVLLLLSGVAVMSGCLSAAGDILPQDKYIAIEEHLQVHSDLISGEYPFPPHITPPVAFIYDGSSTGSNWAEGSSWENARPEFQYPEINSMFKALLGTSYYQDVAPMDTRTGLKVAGIYGFPYACESGFKVEGITRNGTIYGSYNNTSIVLKPGEQWVSPVSSETRTTNGTRSWGNWSPNGMTYDNTTYSYTATYNTSWTVSNLGLLDKSNLT